MIFKIRLPDEYGIRELTVGDSIVLSYPGGRGTATVINLDHGLLTLDTDDLLVPQLLQIKAVSTDYSIGS